MDPLLISGIVFVSVVGLVIAVGMAIKGFGNTSVEDRLAVMTGQKSASSEKKSVMKEELVGEGLAGIFDMFSGLKNRLANLTKLFEQADSPIKAEAFFIITIALGVLGGLGAALGGLPAPIYPVAAIAIGSLPLMWLLMRRKSRFKKFAHQLPDALELVARALRSGHSLNSGMHVVVEEMPPPISTEFGVAYEEQNLGFPIERALKNMLDRMPNLDLKFFVTAVVIQRQAGGDLAEILDKIGHIIRERFKILGQVKALTGEGRISGAVLMALPIGLFVATYSMNPDYVMLLFTDELGRKMIAGAVVMQIIGAIVIKKIINIKV